MEQKKIAVVGCGHWGKNLVRNFFELGSLIAVCDPNDAIAKMFASQYQVENLSFNEILNDSRIHGIVLAVPAPLHASMAIEAMKKRKHVFVEKPLAMDELEGNLMLKCANENQVNLMVGHLLQYHPIFNKLKELKASGKFGELKYIYSNRLSIGKIRSEENVIWSFAPHDISMILSLSEEEPDFVDTNSAAILQNNIEDTATLHMTFESGLKAHVSVSWLHPYKEQKLVVIGTKGMAVFDDCLSWDKKLAFYSHKIEIRNSLPLLEKADVDYIEVPESEPLRNECKHFLDVVSGKCLPRTSGEEGLRVLKILSLTSKQIMNELK